MYSSSGTGLRTVPLPRWAGKRRWRRWRFQAGAPGFAANGPAGARCPRAWRPGADTAILSIFGCDPRTCYTGRAALEAAGAGVTLRQGETCWRVNLATVEGDEFAGALMRSHNGMGIGGREALDTVDALLADAEFSALARELGFVIHPSPTFRQMGVGPWEAPGATRCRGRTTIWANPSAN